MSKILEGRLALITGASRGIGRAVALKFAEQGAHVIALARTQGALEELDDEIRAIGGTCTLVPLDLRNHDEIDRVGAALLDRFGKLDILVGNAGVLGGLSPVGHFTPKLWNEAVAVNLTANYRLIRSLDPLLRASDAGRAIFVTSSIAHGDHPYWGAYAATKAALEAMVRSYAAEVANISPVRANLIDPGRSRTRMRAEAFPGESPEVLPPPEAIVDVFVDLASPACRRNGDLVVAWDEVGLAQQWRRERA